MNIFVLSDDVSEAARMHLDRHVVKMVVEYAQLLSTAHRVLDGNRQDFILPSGKKKTFHLLNDEKTEVREIDGVFKRVIVSPNCYNITHQNHPSAVWARTTSANYQWLFDLFQELSAEYTFRYDKIHKTWHDLNAFLSKMPKNIMIGDRTVFPQAMGDEFKVPNDAIQSYRNYYNGAKAPFATWKKRETPDWFSPS